MEALLLTLDVLAIILLGFSVRRVAKSENPGDLGWFSYLEKKVPVEKKRKMNRNTHAGSDVFCRLFSPVAARIQ